MNLIPKPRFFIFLFIFITFFSIFSRASAATYYFANSIDQSPTELGNYWNNDGLSDPATTLPDFNVDEVNVVSGATFDGNITFNGSATNQGTVTGDATFYNEDPQNNGSVSGTKTRIYTTDTTTTRDFTQDGPWTVVADGAVVDVTGAIYNNTDIFLREHGGSFISNNATYCFNNAVNTDPSELGNYWDDGCKSNHSLVLPIPGLDEITIKADATFDGNIIFNGAASNNGTVTGDATFYDTASNNGTVTGDATFYNEDPQNNGSVSGTKTRIYTTDTTTTRDFTQDGPWTVVADGAVVDVTGASFSNSTIFSVVNNGQFIGITLNAKRYYFNNAVNTDPSELGNYWDNANLTIPSIELPDLSIDQLTILSGAEYVGNAIFRDNGANNGTVTGDATFYNEDPQNNGSVSGTKTRIYTTDTTTTRDFTQDGPWTVVADGAEITTSGTLYDNTTNFLTINNGTFIDASQYFEYSHGSSIKVVYSKVLDETSIPDGTDFQVILNGNNIAISDVSISGRIVTLSLPSNITPSDTVLLNYTTGTHPIKTRAANVGALSNLEVIYGIEVGVSSYWPTTLNGKIYVNNASSQGSISIINKDTFEVSKTISGLVWPARNFAQIGNKLYIGKFSSNPPGVISVIDTVTDTVIKSIEVGINPHLVLMNGTKLYTANIDSNSVSVIDTNTDTVITTIPVGPSPAYLVPFKDKIYVTNYGSNTVSVINTSTNTVINTITVGNVPFYISVVGNKLYVSNQGSRALSVINGLTDTVIATISLADSPYYTKVVGTKVYMLGVDDGPLQIIDTTTDTITKSISTDGLYDATYHNGLLYISGYRTKSIIVFDPITETVLDTIPVGSLYYSHISGDYLYANNLDYPVLSVLDTRTIPSQLPNLTSFSTSSPSGSYDTGDTIAITANFGQALASGSTMTVLLNSGASVVLDQVSGVTLSGTYTVQSGDSSPDLAVTSITSASVTDATNTYTRTSYDLPSSQGDFTIFEGENSFITRNLGDTKNIVINQTPITLDTGSHPYQISASINGYLYVANQGAGTVSVINIASGLLTDTITVGSEPYGLAAVGTKLYVANTGSDTVSVIDTTTNTVSTSVSVGVKPYYVATIGTNVYVTNGASNTVSVIDSDTDTVTATIPVGAYPRGIKAHGTDLYVANYGDPNYSGGNYISVIDSNTNTVSDTIILPAGSDGPRGVTALGSNVYVTNFRSNNVSVINTATNAITATISVGTGPRGIVGLGTKVYVENFDDGTISIINTNNNTVTSTVDVGHSPAGMSIVGTDIYISAFQDDKLRILDTTTGELKEVAPDTTAPTLLEVTPVTTPSTTTTPSYTFSSDEAGTITYGGSCTSSTTSATTGNNTITFSTLATGTYTDCTITVTDTASNASTPLSVTTFTITEPSSSGGSSGGSRPSAPETVVCPPGDLFSTLTGKLCTVSTTQPLTVVNPTTPSTPTTPPSFVFYRNLRIKMTGPDVKALQQALNTVLKLPKPLIVDGIFGNNTLIALKMFQKEKGLIQDGVFGKKSEGAMGGTAKQF